jgi:hypothetical protein
MSKVVDSAFLSAGQMGDLRASSMAVLRAVLTACLLVDTKASFLAVKMDKKMGRNTVAWKDMMKVSLLVCSTAVMLVQRRVDLWVISMDNSSDG